MTLYYITLHYTTLHYITYIYIYMCVCMCVYIYISHTHIYISLSWVYIYIWLLYVQVTSINIYDPDRIHRICTFSFLRVSTEKRNLEYLGWKYFGLDFGARNQNQSKYHRNRRLQQSMSLGKHFPESKNQILTSSTARGGGRSFKALETCRTYRRGCLLWIRMNQGWQSEPTDGPKGGWSCVFWSGCNCCSGHLTCWM